MPGLGRLIEHDPRSRQFVAPMAATRRSVTWPHHAPVLDQGDVGSCTGNAMAQLLNTDVFAGSRGAAGFLTEDDAVTLYHGATVLDGIPGTYPPDDTGSSGLGVAKAAKNLGYITGYTHAFGMNHFLSTLQLQPVIVGTDWTESMFTPNAKGYVTPSGPAVGGHEYLALGVDYGSATVTFLNSWSATWGQQGRFHMTFTSFGKLLANHGDVVAPRAATP